MRVVVKKNSGGEKKVKFYMWNLFEKLNSKEEHETNKSTKFSDFSII